MAQPSAKHPLSLCSTSQEEGLYPKSTARKHKKTDGDEKGDRKQWPDSSGLQDRSQALQTALLHFESHLIFQSGSLLCILPSWTTQSIPHYPLFTLLRKICLPCYKTKYTSTGISGSQHRGFALPSVKEHRRIYWKGQWNRRMMKDSTAAYPGCHELFLIITATTVMIHWGTWLAETLLLAHRENSAGTFILIAWQRHAQYIT